MDYTANGRYMAMAGRKGHMAIIDTQTLKQIKEFQVGSGSISCLVL